MAQSNSEPANLQSVVHHIFLPPKLPQQASQDDEQRRIDLDLVRLVAEALSNYRDLEQGPHEPYAQMARTLAQVSKMIEVPLEVSQLQRALSEMETGGWWLAPMAEYYAKRAVGG